MKRIVFIDRDGTIIEEPPDRQIDSLAKLSFIPGVIGGLRLLREAGYSLIMVSNQDGLGSPRYPRKVFQTVQRKILGLLEGEGIRFEKIFICPHRESDRCSCRKPLTGLLRSYLAHSPIDRAHSFVLGDRETDVQFASNLGVRSVRLTRGRSSAELATPHLAEACSYIARSAREARFSRTTAETSIDVRLMPDGDGVLRGKTGIGFFDHMLAQLVRHSGMDVVMSVRGDLEVDEHHTVEDTGIALGNALRLVLGTKRGLNRFGYAAPLDEALAEVSIDLSGRSYLSFPVSFRRERVGDLPTELVEDFFKAFADGLRATIHIRCSGRNDHHKIEAIFKTTARALRQAIAIDPRRKTAVPSTKGTL
ncbi:MAG TPA: bifunctional histidinol-phosphatase/imidazoleglycerol-phosphate dehydratase HisB [Bacteroidota bacterium]|nr:bifunctional histidinol-phosphatase/imidazoleglycerol-phosphate dehydratase HisB [Bacteroidota bacterium]